MCHSFREESEYGIYKEQLEEPFTSKEPTGPVQNAEQVFFPLDEKLRLQPGSLTPLQLSHLVHFASFHAFGQAAQMLKEHHGVQVSASTSRRQTEEIAASAEVVQNEQARAKFVQKNSPPRKDAGPKEAVKQVMSSDGAYISLRGKGWAEVKTLLVGVVQEKTRHSTQRPDQEVKTTSISYFSRMTDAETFSELATSEIDRRGFFQTEQVCAVQDGAEWIQNVIDAHRADAVRILDFYHAAEYVSDIATLLSNAGTPLAENWVNEQCHELKHQGPEKVLEEVGRLLKDHPSVVDLDKKVHYLQKRENLMQYPLFQQQGWPLGSGCVESANKCVVQKRLKGPGMHWEHSNVNPMLALRTGVCNDRWDETQEQAYHQRLLTRRAKRIARSAVRYEVLEHEVKKTLLRFFLLLSPLKQKQTHVPFPSQQAEEVAPSSGLSDPSPQPSSPAQSHPWRRFTRAKK